jgi:hypothetical protein
MEAIQAQAGVTTKECEQCHYVFERYLDHGTLEAKRGEQRVCANCMKPVIVVIVRHFGETL